MHREKRIPKGTKSSATTIAKTTMTHKHSRQNLAIRRASFFIAIPEEPPRIDERNDSIAGLEPGHARPDLDDLTRQVAAGDVGEARPEDQA